MMGGEFPPPSSVSTRAHSNGAAKMHARSDVIWVVGGGGSFGGGSPHFLSSINTGYQSAH